MKINTIDHIETGKTIFGSKVTVSENDYEKLTDLAKKQIADEGKESKLSKENAELKKENEKLTSENSTLRESVRAAQSLRNSFWLCKGNWRVGNRGTGK
ncbi:MAG: hypothetical protein HDT42_00355 [Ruminococcaceae bacterium]|nr:hypothetical protein [Oscillospiraceae bacterium]